MGSESMRACLRLGQGKGMKGGFQEEGWIKRG